MLNSTLRDSLVQREPVLWLNESWGPLKESALSADPQAVSLRDVGEAEQRLSRFAGLLQKLFPELQPTGGIIESPLVAVESLQRAILGAGPQVGRWYIKCDHALPVAGSVKARGGIYEVLAHAEELGRRRGLLDAQDDDLSVLSSPRALKLFAQHRVAVGSTGNLGLSIGVMAAALGFQATVHMSAEAKGWKKARLRARGVEVIEHTGDFTAAVAAGREQAQSDPNTYFVDDEKSSRLFLGYAVAALRLRKQLSERGITVDDTHPLFVYLPCGVGGAPGGITFGLRHMFGDHVHCFFAEPVASACMLVRLAHTDNYAVSVTDVGLDNRTEADGLAVARASEFVAAQIRSLVSGVFTVRDDTLFEDLYLLEQTERLWIEPSAAAGFRGPHWILRSPPGRQYQTRHGLSEHMDRATHILWTTGGAFVPEAEYQRFHDRGRTLRAQRINPTSATSL